VNSRDGGQLKPRPRIRTETIDSITQPTVIYSLLDTGAVSCIRMIEERWYIRSLRYFMNSRWRERVEIPKVDNGFRRGMGGVLAI